MIFGIEWPYKSKSYVLTHQKLDKPKNGEVEFYSGELKDFATLVKKESKKDIWLIGGANIVQNFLKESLIDEVILSIMPVFLGSGISLFSNEGFPSDATLLNSQSYDSGVVQTHYILNNKK